MLRNLATSLHRGDGSAALPSMGGAPPQNYTAPSVADSSTAYDHDVQSDDDVDQAFEGNSSMAAHTVFASEFLEQAVTNNTSLGRQLNPDIQNALASLQQLVKMQNQKGNSHESRFAHQKPVPKGGVKELPLPPTRVVVQLLREIKGISTSLWCSAHPYSSTRNVFLSP